jgi:hypothetical protein
MAYVHAGNPIRVAGHVWIHDAVPAGSLAHLVVVPTPPVSRTICGLMKVGIVVGASCSAQSACPRCVDLALDPDERRILAERAHPRAWPKPRAFDEPPEAE